MAMVAEGVDTALSVHQLCEKDNLQLPIMNEVYNMLFQDKDPGEVVATLLRVRRTRSGKPSTSAPSRKRPRRRNKLLKKQKGDRQLLHACPLFAFLYVEFRMSYVV